MGAVSETRQPVVSRIGQNGHLSPAEEMPRIVPLLSQDAPEIRARHAENAVSKAFNNPDLRLESPKGLSGVGKRVERAEGMLSGGLLRIKRIKEIADAVEAPEFLTSETIAKRFEEDVQFFLDPDNQLVNVKGMFGMLSTKLREAVEEFSAISTQGETELRAKNNIVEGFSLAMRGALRLDALEKIQDMPEMQHASLEQMNDAWTLSLTGANESVIHTFLAYPQPTETVQAVANILEKESLRYPKESLPEYVITARQDVSLRDFEQIAAYTLPPSFFHDILRGKDAASINLVQEGKNHFLLTFHTLAKDGKLERRDIAFGANFRGAYVDYTTTGEKLPINTQQDEAFYLIRKLGNIDLTKPGEAKRMDRVVLDAAQKIDAKWDPRDDNASDFDYRQIGHDLKPRREGTPQFSMQDLLRGKVWRREYSITIDGKPVRKTGVGVFEGAYAFLEHHVNGLKKLVEQEKADKSAKQSQIADTVLSESRKPLAPSRMPVSVMPTFTDPVEAIQEARKHGGIFQTSKDGKTFYVIPTRSEDLPTEPRFVQEPPKPQTRRQKILSVLASLF